MTLNIHPTFPHLTVGDLKELIKDLPDNMPVAYQRIEDMYFEENGWTTNKLRWDYPIFTGEYDKDGKKIYVENLSEYITAFSAYKHPDEEVFVINAHY